MIVLDSASLDPRATLQAQDWEAAVAVCKEVYQPGETAAEAPANREGLVKRLYRCISSGGIAYRNSPAMEDRVTSRRGPSSPAHEQAETTARLESAPSVLTTRVCSGFFLPSQEFSKAHTVHTFNTPCVLVSLLQAQKATRLSRRH